MFEQQYKETFSQVVASDSLMQEVLNLNNKKSKSKVRVLTLAAAVMLVFALATTAFAYTGFVVYENPGQMLDALFGAGAEKEHEGKTYVDEYGQDRVDPNFQREELDKEAAEEYVAPHIFQVGQSVTYKGNTLTVDAISYDANTQCGVVYVHLDNPDGVPEYYLQTSGELTWNGQSVIRSRVMDVTYFLDEAQSSETSLALAGYFYVSDYYAGAQKDLTGILYMGDLDGDASDVISIPLDTVTSMEHITLGGGGIQLSPIGIVIHGNKLGILSESSETLVDYVCIRYTDGSEYLVMDDTGDIPTINCARGFSERGEFNDYGYDFAGDYETDRYCVTYLLNRVVSLKDVAEVIVDGVSYSVDGEAGDQLINSGPENEDNFSYGAAESSQVQEEQPMEQSKESTGNFSSGAAEETTGASWDFPMEEVATSP